MTGFGTQPLVLYAADATGTDDDLNTYEIDTGNLRAMSQFKLVPGLSVSVAVPPDAIVVVMSSGSVTTAATSPQEYSAADVMLFLDGHIAGWTGSYERVIAAPPIKLTNWSLHAAEPLSPGQHTFAVKARGVVGSVDATLGGHNRPAAGALTVMILKR